MDLVGHTNNVYDVTESPVVNTAMAAQIGINTPSITEEHPRINYRRTNALSTTEVCEEVKPRRNS